MKNYIIKLKPLIFWLGFTLIGGVLSGLMTLSASEYYNALSKPSWAPSGWIFGVVWPILYILIGFAAYLVSVSGCNSKRKALAWYIIQLLANFAWSPVFFALRNQALALWILVLLLILAVITANYFYRCNRWSGILLIPYILWLIFALALSISIFSRG